MCPEKVDAALTPSRSNLRLTSQIAQEAEAAYARRKDTTVEGQVVVSG